MIVQMFRICSFRVQNYKIF